MLSIALGGRRGKTKREKRKEEREGKEGEKMGFFSNMEISWKKNKRHFIKLV
jgi:hypothetical protein